MGSANKAIRWQSNDLLLAIYVQPKASRTQVVGFYQGHIKIQITAQAIENMANTFLLAWLAKEFDVPKTRVSLEKGQHSRFKLCRIQAPAVLPGWFSALKG